MWKPDWYGVEIRVLSLLNVLFLWRIRQGRAAGIGASLQKWAQPRKESPRSRDGGQRRHQQILVWSLAARFSFPHFLFTCEASLLLSYLVCKSSRATSSARGALRFGMAVWCLPFSDLGHTFHCIGTAPYRDGARVATRVFETGQKASDQTFANGRPEACCEGISLYLHTLSTGSSLDKETSTIIPQWKGLSRAKDGALDFFSSNPEPTSQLYR